MEMRERLQAKYLPFLKEFNRSRKEFGKAVFRLSEEIHPDFERAKELDDDEFFDALLDILPREHELSTLCHAQLMRIKAKKQALADREENKTIALSANIVKLVDFIK